VRAEPVVLPGGAALLDQASSTAHVLIDDGAVARFGPALAWADRAGAASVDVYVDGSPTAPGIVARRAACFAWPVRVWSVSGRSLSPAVPSEPVVSPPLPAPELAALLAAEGLEVVYEHGVLRGEVLGLEVARTVGGRLEVGVGRHDRRARLDLSGGVDMGSSLAAATDVVRRLRRPGAPPHPANTLARSRWLRSLIVRRPASFGLDLCGVEPVSPPLPWFDLTEAGAAPAVGYRPDGSRVVVVCSVGVDLDLVPTAADCRILYGPAELWLVLPSRDDLRVTRSLAGRLDPPAVLYPVTFM
jgi:hypothetical protein